MAQNLSFERVYNAPINKVWKAITDKDQMKEWYFELESFKAEPGFEFTFYGGTETKRYLHLCKVLEATPVTRLSYSWKYERYPGESIVTWQLEPLSKSSTKLTLTHTGLETFPQDLADFSVASFTQGWTYITGTSLTEFVETDMISETVSIQAQAATIWQLLLSPESSWGKSFGGGAVAKTDWKQGSPITWYDGEGNIGSTGIITLLKENEKIEMQHYDNIPPLPGDELGEYKEVISLHPAADGSTTVGITVGPLAKKYIESHGKMWKEAATLIKSTAELTKN